jgi:UDP:flavonoid glycosyltransferase YjiC (YdhE family)
MKVLFLTADLGGNIPPTLAVAQALARRGISVEIAGLLPDRTALPHIPFPLANAITPDSRPQGPRELLATFRLMASRTSSRDALKIIVERRPDVVVVDCMLPAVIRAALASHVPTVVLFHTFSTFWMHTFDRGPFGRLLGFLGLRPALLWNGAASRLFLTDADIDPGRYDPALAGYVWTGTTEVGHESQPCSNLARPRVLVALSSTPFPGMFAVYRRIIAALSTLPLDAVVTTGGVDLGGQLQGSAHIEIRGWADHGQILPTVDLMIAHGGHSSTLKALAHGVPLLILPVNPIADQRLIGRIVDSLGAGRWLPKTARSAVIRHAVVAILADTSIIARARSTGRRLRARTDGAEVAADHIEAILDAADPELPRRFGI